MTKATRKSLEIFLTVVCPLRISRHSKKSEYIVESEYNQSEISRARWRMLKHRLVLSLLGQYRSQCPAFILGSNVRTKTNY